jgi:hypothetical protein
MVEDQGILDASFANLQPSGGHAEVSIDLAIRSEGARAQVFEGGTHMGDVVEMSLEFKIEELHECEPPHQPMFLRFPDGRD